MDKYSVVTDLESQKIASESGRPCPECGSGKVDYRSTTPHCPNCGTHPWETKDVGRDRRDFRRG